MTLAVCDVTTKFAFDSGLFCVCLRSADVPQTSDEWLALLKQQEKLHDEELNRWQEILTTSITLMDHMKATLTELKSTIENRDSLTKDVHTAASKIKS